MGILIKLKRTIMKRIHIKSLGFATGLTAALLYLGCALVMNFTSAETTRTFFNSLFHGIDIGNMLRMNISFRETVLGAFQTFIFAWLSGASIAAIYNIFVSRRKISEKNFINT